MSSARSTASRLVFGLALSGLLALTGAAAAQTRENPTLRYSFGSVGLGVGALSDAPEPERVEAVE